MTTMTKEERIQFRKQIKVGDTLVCTERLRTFGIKEGEILKVVEKRPFRDDFEIILSRTDGSRRQHMIQSSIGCFELIEQKTPDDLYLEGLLIASKGAI